MLGRLILLISTVALLAATASPASAAWHFSMPIAQGGVSAATCEAEPEGTWIVPFADEQGRVLARVEFTMPKVGGTFHFFAPGTRGMPHTDCRMAGFSSRSCAKSSGSRTP